MHKLQVLNAIVSTNTVDVMNTLSGQERPSKRTRHHKSMFEYAHRWSSALGAIMHRSHRHSKFIGRVGVQQDVPMYIQMLGIASTTKTMRAMLSDAASAILVFHTPNHTPSWCHMSPH
jgi:hypothetical protein